MASNASAAVAWLALAVAGLGVGLAIRAGSGPSKDRTSDEDADLLNAKSVENRLHDAETRLESSTNRVRELEERLTKAERATEAAAAASKQAMKAAEDAVRTAATGKGPPDTAVAEDAAKKAEVEEILGSIREGKFPEGGGFPLFQKAKELGVLDQALAEMEKYAAAHLSDADAQVELATAYVVKLMAVPDGPEKGAWSQKSINACEAALKADPENWSAQFVKGMNLSQWPAFLGKQPEAIRTFEKLIVQQEKSAPEAKFAQTYFQLGTTYRSAGNLDKARAAFARGLELFPDSKQLRDQLEAMDKR